MLLVTSHKCFVSAHCFKSSLFYWHLIASWNITKCPRFISNFFSFLCFRMDINRISNVALDKVDLGVLLEVIPEQWIIGFGLNGNFFDPPSRVLDLKSNLAPYSAGHNWRISLLSSDLIVDPAFEQRLDLKDLLGSLLTGIILWSFELVVEV